MKKLFSIVVILAAFSTLLIAEETESSSSPSAVEKLEFWRICRRAIYSRRLKPA